MGPAVLGVFLVASVCWAMLHRCSHSVVRKVYGHRTVSLPVSQLRRSAGGLGVRFVFGDEVTSQRTRAAFEWFGGVLRSAVHPSESFGEFNAIDCYKYKTIATDADLTVFVSSEDAHCGSYAIAWAAVCQIEYRTGRPLSAVVNVCPGSEPSEDAALRLVIAHETMHALGFSSQFLRSESFYENSALVRKITAPGPLSEARAHFGCSGMGGVEVSPDGSHLAERLYFDDCMSPVLTEKSVITPLDFAVLDGLGFYAVNWTEASGVAGGKRATWGAGLGCAFAELGCLASYARNRAESPFCFESGRMCTFDRSAVGVCGLYKYGVQLPARYSYFTDPTIGGRECMDYCPYVEPVEQCQPGQRCLDFGELHECHACSVDGPALILDGEIVLNCSAPDVCSASMPEGLASLLCEGNSACASGALETLCVSGIAASREPASHSRGSGASLALAVLLTVALSLL